MKSALFVLLILLVGCNQYSKKDRNLDYEKLLYSNELQKKAHLTNDAKLLVSQIADTMVTVSRGKVYKNSNEQIYNRFSNYFKNIEYIKWDDIEEPIINISDDGSSAEMILRKIILVRQKNEKNEWEKGATIFSWTANHKKINNEWKIVSNASTREDLEFASSDDYYIKAINAFKEKNYSEYLTNIELAYSLSKNISLIEFEYAKALSLNNKLDEAVKIYDRLLSKRFYKISEIKNDSIFLKLSKTKGYENLLSKIEIAEMIINNSDTAFVIKEKDLIPEGISYDNNTKSIFLSSAFKRKILKIDSTGNITNYKNSGEDNLYSTWGMEVDEKRNHLWVISALTKEGMLTNKNYDNESPKSRVYKYDTVTGALLKIYNYDSKKEDHFFNDLTISKNGTVYITESLTSKIYKINPEKDELELLFDADKMFFFLNGIALNKDETKLFVTSSEGVSILELETKKWFYLQVPDYISTEGIDGLTYYKGSLICQQGGYPNNSIMQYFLSDDESKIISQKILESNNPLFDNATTGEIGGEYYFYIANSQVNSAFIWGKNGPEKIKPLKELNELVILKVKL